MLITHVLYKCLQFLANYDYNDQDPYLATVDAKDNMGQTVLHAAVRTNWTDGVCIALGAGASVFMKVTKFCSIFYLHYKFESLNVSLDVFYTFTQKLFNGSIRNFIII